MSEMVRPPMTDEEIESMLLAGNERPIHPGWTYVNWQNDFPNMASMLVEAWNDSPLAFRETVMLIARQVAEEALTRENAGREPTNDELLATMLRTVMCPANNVGTRTNFIRGALAEVDYSQMLEINGYTVLDTEVAEKVTGVSPAKQETNGWDIVARNPDGDIETFQVKATSSRPSKSARKKADATVWYKHTGSQLKEPRVIHDRR